MDIMTKAAQATRWSAVEVLARQSMHFVIAVILARILSPDAFGVYAMLALYIAVAGIFIDFGTGSALIHYQDATLEDESAMFWFNLLVAILVAALLAGATPALVRFYNVHELEAVSYLLAINLVVSAMGNIHRVLLAKRLFFRRLMFVNLFVLIVSGCIAISMGLAGYGVIALALQSLAGGITGTVLLWIQSDWCPKSSLDIGSLRRLITFGRYWFGVQMLNVVHARLNTVLIGKYHGPEVLGYYLRGETNAALPATMVSSIFERVAFPAFSGLSSDRASFRQQVRMTLRASMLINAPAVLGLMAVANPFVTTIFGESWRPAVPYLQILCLSRLFIPIYDINLLVFMARGRPREYFHFECLTKPLFLALTACAAMVSVEAIAWSMVISAWLSSILLAAKAGQVIGYGFTSQLRDLTPSILLATIMAAAVWTVAPIFAGLPTMIELLLEVITGILVFAGLAILFDHQAIWDMRKLLFIYREDAVPEPS